jgi:hypothetical protein
MTKSIHRKKEKLFLDLKAPAYKNKTNGQISIVLPRKELKKITDVDFENMMIIPKTIPIRIFRWRK